MVSIRAHFDGKVFVPDEPVALPPDAPVQVLFAPAADGRRPLLELARALEGLPEDPDWPADGAAEVDHYLYGTPKRNADEPEALPPNAAARLLVAPDADGDRPLMELARLAAQFPDDPDWPADGAAEIDHYLYGTPKKNT